MNAPYRRPDCPSYRGQEPFLTTLGREGLLPRYLAMSPARRRQLLEALANDGHDPAMVRVALAEVRAVNLTD